MLQLIFYFSFLCFKFISLYYHTQKQLTTAYTYNAELTLLRYLHCNAHKKLINV